MKILSNEEQENLNYLEQNIDEKLLEFKKKNETKKLGELEEKLLELENYLDGVKKNEIDDALINIIFKQKKAEILRTLIKNKK